MTAQLSRERLEEIVNAAGLEPCDSDEVFDSIKHWEIVKMSRMLLAAMDSEPVGEVVLGDYDDCGDYPDAKVVCIAAQGQADWNNFRNGTKLYAAPPAPAIPDHLELIDKGRLMMLERSHQTLLDYRADSVWYWQGDEDDQPGSLSCPVIMSAETLRELLAKAAPPAPVAVPDDESESEMKWRDLALQFDGHRMQSLCFLKYILSQLPETEFFEAREFLKSGPLPGEEVLRNRITAMLKGDKS